MNSVLLKIEKLTKKYKSKIALDDFNIEIKKGSIFGLVGQNGAGKTTLIRIINQIIEADQGNIWFDGELMGRDVVRQIGYLPEERGLYKNMTVEEQALYFGQLKGLSKKQAQIALTYWLDKFELKDWRKKKIQQLSKGMAQKVQFIITVLHEPELLILDEPFSGFDPVNAQLIADEIKALAAKGTTVIFSSHRMESVEQMCNEICLIHHGKILLNGSIDTLKRQYALKEYQITLMDVNDDLLSDFKTKYKVDQKNTENGVKLVVKQEEDGNQLLSDLLAIGTVTNYEEVLPSMQNIFIKTIAHV